MRKRELEEEKDYVIEYILIIFISKSSKGAYINIYLELEGGLRLRDKLYS